VVADAVHEKMALHGMVAGLLDEEPELAGDVVFGARAAVMVERRFSSRLLAAWRAGGTSLLRPLPPDPAP
jgi:hypothetical protein